MESTSGHRLQTADFIMFAVMLCVSVSIGIYYAVSGQKQRSTSEFLVGSRQMSFLPVAVSLIVSFQSSIMILGAPAEAYLYGMQFVVGTVGTMVVILLSARYMVPTFKSLNLTTAFEYLELRYQSRAVYVLGSLLAMVTNVWYMGIVLFGPAVALEAVTGFPQYQSIFLIAAVSVLYTSIGGIKAVVWTDVFQAFVMLVGLVSVSVKATIDGGGITEVWARAYNSGRINFFNFDPSLTVRHTFWNLVLSDMTSGLSAVYSQQTIQRVNSTRSLRDAQRIVLLLGPAFVVCVVVAAAEGVVAQSYFTHTECDPLKAKHITNPNQLIPYLVMEMFNQLPGMPGLFLATLFSASLSTLSSCLSSLSSQAWRDFLRPTFPNVSDAKGALLAKLSVVLFGLIGCGVAMMIARMSGPLTQILGSLVHAASAPTSGLFVLGCFFPWANAKGAIIGGLSSMAVVTWIGIGTSFSGVAKETPWLHLGTTQGCFPNNVTQSLTNVSSVTAITESLGEDVYGINVVYLLSYKWIPILGLIIVLLVGSLASLVTGGNKDRQVDQRYLVSFCDQMCCCLPGRILSFFRHKSLNHNTAKGEEVLNEELESCKDKLMSENTVL